MLQDYASQSNRPRLSHSNNQEQFNPNFSKNYREQQLKVSIRQKNQILDLVNRVYNVLVDTNLQHKRKLERNFRIFLEYAKNLGELLSNLEKIIKKNQKEEKRLKMKERISDFKDSLVKITDGKLVKSADGLVGNEQQFEPKIQNFDDNMEFFECPGMDSGRDLIRKAPSGAGRRINQRKPKNNKKKDKRVKKNLVKSLEQNREADTQKGYNKTNIISIEFLQSMNNSLIEKEKFFKRLIDYISKNITIHKVSFFYQSF